MTDIISINNYQYAPLSIAAYSKVTGYYKRLKNRVIFFDLDKKPFAALIKNGNGCHLVNCTKINNRYFYQFGLSDLYKLAFGLPEKYSQQMEYIDNLANKFI